MENSFRVRVDLAAHDGPVRPLHGVNEGPMTKVFTYDARPEFKEIGIPLCRLHDTEYPFGSGEFVDIPCIFKNFDADRYADMCFDVIESLTTECGRITALSVDTQGETMILADADGRPLCPAVVWLDNRAGKEADLIRERFGNRRVYEVTGQAEISAGWPACKLLWFRNNRPDMKR